jgi:hypothetical protein
MDNKIIEETIEKKFNQLITQIPNILNDNSKKDETDFFNFSLNELYHNTLKTIIDIINDIMRIIDNNNQENYLINILDIFFNEKRMFYIGIILIILSFVIYFIDGATI